MPPASRVTYESDPDSSSERGARGRHPRDPRVVFRNHRERGPARFPRRRPGWTKAMVAEARGVTVAAVDKAVQRGQLDLNDLASVIAWAVRPRAGGGARR